MTSARPPKAPTGRPPPMILPNVVRSGRTPRRSCAPREAHRVPRGLCARVPAADALDRRHPALQELRQTDLVLRRARERETVLGRLLDRLHDVRVGVAEDQARVVAVEVETVGAVGVPDVCALPALDVERVRIEERGGPAVAAGHDRQRFLVQRARAARLRGVLGNLFVDTHADSSLTTPSRDASHSRSSRCASSTVTALNRTAWPGRAWPMRAMSNEQTVATFV